MASPKSSYFSAQEMGFALQPKELILSPKALGWGMCVAKSEDQIGTMKYTI
jgi:hypothetical protein